LSVCYVYLFIGSWTNLDKLRAIENCTAATTSDVSTGSKKKVEIASRYKCKNFGESVQSKLQ